MSSGQRRRFYKSKLWKQTRETYLESVNRICERCGKAAAIVHHRRYLTDDNLNDLSVSVCFDNLEALCFDCHNKEHFRARATEQGLTFDENGNLIRV